MTVDELRNHATNLAAEVDRLRVCKAWLRREYCKRKKLAAEVERLREGKSKCNRKNAGGKMPGVDELIEEIASLCTKDALFMRDLMGRLDPRGAVFAALSQKIIESLHLAVTKPTVRAESVGVDGVGSAFTELLDCPGVPLGGRVKARDWAEKLSQSDQNRRAREDHFLCGGLFNTLSIECSAAPGYQRHTNLSCQDCCSLKRCQICSKTWSKSGVSQGAGFDPWELQRLSSRDKVLSTPP